MVSISVTKEELETLFVQISIDGLTPGQRYDVLRLQTRYLGKDDTGARRYERELPDRRGLWRSVAHRIGWQAPQASVRFRDYECPMRPTRYFVCSTSAVSPAEYTDWRTPYPLLRGAITPLDDTGVVHFGQDLRDLLNAPVDEGHLMVRSTADLAKYASACVVDLDGPHYNARGTEFAIMGSQFPVYVSDSRESRRGTVTLMMRDLGAYLDFRDIVFPVDGAMRPVVFNAGSDNTMLLDDMVTIILDVEVEQVTTKNPALRYVHLDFIEIDPSTPLVARSGDNDVMTDEPHANFSYAPANPGRGDWVTLTDTSSGQGDTWEWSVSSGSEGSNFVSKFFTQGPHKVKWTGRGDKTVKLRFGGSGQGFHTRTKTITVH